MNDKWPSVERFRAQMKQRAKGNDPRNTRPSREVRLDGPRDVLTGLRYRRALEEKLRRLRDET